MCSLPWKEKITQGRAHGFCPCISCLVGSPKAPFIMHSHLLCHVVDQDGDWRRNFSKVELISFALDRVGRSDPWRVVALN